MLKPALLFLAALLPLAAPAQDGSAGRLADVQIYDRSDGRFLPLHRHRGRIYVAGEPGHQYEIRVRNQRDERLLAVTSVDGVNVISGQTAATDQGGYVLPPWDEVQIDGWRKSMDRVATFYFTSLPDSYAARTGRPDEVGVIGVALFKEQRRWSAPWRGRDDYAADRAEEATGAAAPQAKSRAESDSRLGTGHGHSEWSGAEYTEFERASERPAEVIAIYYDSRRNLVAQGVIPRRHARRPLRPNPFPAGFVPDP